MVPSTKSFFAQDIFCPGRRAPRYSSDVPTHRRPRKISITEFKFGQGKIRRCVQQLYNVLTTMRIKTLCPGELRPGEISYDAFFSRGADRQTDTVLESSHGNMSAHKKFQLKAQN